MARLFDKASSEYCYVDAQPVAALPLTVSLLMKHSATNPSAYEYLFFYGDTSQTFSFLGIFFNLDSSGNLIVWERNSANQIITASDYADGNWHVITVTVESTGSPQTTTTLYIDGGLVDSDVDNDASSIDNFDRVAIGMLRNSSPSFPFSGDMAGIAMWDVKLNTDEIASLGDRLTPDQIRPQSLKAYWDLIRGLNDKVGGYNLTASGTTVSNHPRIIQPYRPFYSFPSAGAPPAYNIPEKMKHYRMLRAG